MRRLVAGVALALALGVGSCSHPEDEAEPGKPVGAKLISTQLAGNGLSLADGVTLTNVTGLADSIGASFRATDSGEVCGFSIWAADGQATRSGLAGRTYEAFDLGDPVSWSSMGAGMQGKCESGTASQIETYFVYLDLHVKVGADAKVVRAYLGQQAPFEAGDLAIQQGSAFYWYDKDAGVLVAEGDTRPTNPARFELSKEVPWFDNNGTEEIILLEFRIELASQSYKLTKETGHVTVDVDFANSGIAISDTSSDGAILNTIALPFLDTTASSGLLNATLTIANDRPPEPAE